jgi:TRAP-type uncharacterized transport system substrate-binding protein
VGLYNFVVAHRTLPDDLVYGIAEAVFANRDEMMATLVCPHLPPINSGSGFYRGSHSTAHYHLGYRSRLGFRDRGNLLRYHSLRFTLR